MARPTGFEHDPVMAREVLELLAPVPGGTVVDATVGGGGHARLLLESRPDVTVLGIDRDADAVAAARERLAPFGDRVHVVHGGFEDVAEIVRSHASAGAGGPESEGNIMAILFDLGTSSPQLDRPERGFSYWGEAPLDMRMDAAQELTAETVVNTYPEARLAGVIGDNGEERFARQIAVAHRGAPSAAHHGGSRRRGEGGDPGTGATAWRAPRASHVPGDPHGGQPRAPEPRRRARRVGPPARTRWPHPRARVPLARGPHGEGAVRRLGGHQRRAAARLPGRARAHGHRASHHPSGGPSARRRGRREPACAERAAACRREAPDRQTGS